jgi:toluene monooxygenase system protein E
MKARRTYWHLEALRRVPSEYDIGSSRLLYYRADRGFEVPTPAGEWHCRTQLLSPFRARDWESFRDPRETTYASYTALQKEKETFVEGLLRSVEGSDYDRRLSERWLGVLGATLPVLRYPCHGLQMVTAFVAQTAPASRIVIGCAFQTGDEIRRIQRFAYRMAQLRLVEAGFGERSKTAWQRDPEWQPLRQVVETLLVTYDFGEAFVALNLVLKPVFDRLLTHDLGQLAEENGDPMLGKLLFSLGEDTTWHRSFGQSLVRFAIESEPANKALVESWVRRWRPPVRKAVAALGPLFQSKHQGMLGDIETDARRMWDALGIDGGST